jgi:hypothetical protein
VDNIMLVRQYQRFRRSLPHAGDTHPSTLDRRDSHVSGVFRHVNMPPHPMRHNSHLRTSFPSLEEKTNQDSELFRQSSAATQADHQFGDVTLIKGLSSTSSRNIDSRTVRELRTREATKAESDSRDGILSRTGVFKAAYS